MDKALSKKILFSLLVLLIIATIIYAYFLRSAFHEGRAVYLKGTRVRPDLVSIDSKGRPWVEPYLPMTLMVLDGDSWITYSTDTFNIPYSNLNLPFHITALAADGSGNVWAGSDSGLLLFDGDDWQILNAANSGIASNRIENLAIDSLDRVWITYDPLPWEEIAASAVTIFDGINWNTFTMENSGLTSNEVTSVAFDTHNRAWISTTENVFVLDGDQWTRHTLAFDTSANYIESVAVDGLGRAWANISARHGSGSAGVLVFDGEKWSDFNPADAAASNCTRIVSLLFIDSLGRFWFGCRFDAPDYWPLASWNEGGVRIFDGHTWVSFPEDNGYGDPWMGLAEGEDGRIWVASGSAGGLASIEPDYDLARAARIQPQRVFLWGGGLVYLVLVLGVLLAATHRDTLPQIAIPALIGMVCTLGFAMLLGDWHLLIDILRSEGGGLYLLNPGVLITLGGISGAFVGERQRRATHRPRRAVYVSTVIGLLVGLGPGCCIDFIVLFIWAFLHA